MPLNVEKQGKESSQGIVRRFTLKLRKSGVLFEARRRRFKKKPESKQLRKRAALRRVEKKKEYTEMRKLGKIKYKYKR